MKENRRHTFSGSDLKWIAIVTMFIDHAGYTLAWSLFLNTGARAAFLLYAGMRFIGRLAFPIFCFLLAEGFFHTRSRAKYALRLGLFTLLAEVPFDLVVAGTWWSTDDQNVFCTLFLGFCAMWVSETIRQKHRQLFWPGAAAAAATALFGVAANLLRTDYSLFGVVLIMAFYLRRLLNNEETDCPAAGWGGFLPAASIAAYCIVKMNPMELPALLSLPVISRYNGERGMKLKWVFYLFYPVHLALLAGLQRLLF